jgi:sugar lactone lactonase YvrE
MCRHRLSIITLCLSLVAPGLRLVSAPAQTATGATELRSRIEVASRLRLDPTDLRIKLRKGEQLGMVSWLSRDAKSGITWLIQRGDRADPVLAVDGNGHVVHSFGKGLFKIPHSIRIDPDGNPWTVDAGSSRIIKFSPAGRELLYFDLGGQPRSSDGSFTGATDIAFYRGRVFITDGYANARVVEYTMDGRKLREWGTAGTGPGQFHLPHSIVADQDGTLYVADRENGRIQVFDAEGSFLREIGHLGRVIALQIASDALWATVAPPDEPPGSAGWIIQLNPRTGMTVGYVPVTDTPGLHCLELADDGEPMTGIGSKVIIFRPSPVSHP